MSALAPIVPRLAKLLPLLSSDKSGEVVAAANAIGRTLATVNADWHDLVAHLQSEPRTVVVYRDVYRDPPSAEPSDWRAMLRVCADRYSRLSVREQQFVASLANWRGRPTPKQMDWLEAIYERVRAPA